MCIYNEKDSRLSRRKKKLELYVHVVHTYFVFFLFPAHSSAFDEQIFVVFKVYFICCLYWFSAKARPPIFCCFIIFKNNLWVSPTSVFYCCMSLDLRNILHFLMKHHIAVFETIDKLSCISKNGFTSHSNFLSNFHIWSSIC